MQCIIIILMNAMVVGASSHKLENMNIKCHHAGNPMSLIACQMVLYWALVVSSLFCQLSDLHWLLEPTL